MTRSAKSVEYDASDDTIREFFRRAQDLRSDRKDVSVCINALNQEMEAAGVHPAIIAKYQRLADIPPDKRSLVIHLERRYLKVLEEQLLAGTQIDIEELAENQLAPQRLHSVS